MNGRRSCPRGPSGTAAHSALVVASGNAGLDPSPRSDHSLPGGPSSSPSFTPRATPISTPPRSERDRASKHGGDAPSAATTGPRRSATARTVVAARDAPASPTPPADAMLGAKLKRGSPSHRWCGSASRTARQVDRTQPSQPAAWDPPVVQKHDAAAAQVPGELAGDADLFIGVLLPRAAALRISDQSHKGQAEQAEARLGACLALRVGARTHGPRFGRPIRRPLRTSVVAISSSPG
jgi:hypothetical protein